MTSRTIRGAWIRGAALLVAGVVGSGSGLAVAQQPTAPAGSDAAAQEAILKALTVESLIGDAVSLSNQQYPEVESAIKRFLNNDVVGAREFLELAKQKYPKLPPTDLTLAKMQVIVRNAAVARALLEKTITEFPNDPEAYLYLGDFAFGEGRITEAHLLFLKAQELNKTFAENEKRKNRFDLNVLTGLATVCERRAQWAEAQALLQQLVALDPDNALAHLRLGATLFRLDKPTEALEEFKKARELDDTANHPQVFLGTLYTQGGKVEDARKAFETAYAAEPDNEGTARAYAEWLIQQNDLDKAQAVAAAMRKKTPASVAALLLDGVVAKMRNQNEAAEEAFLKVLTIDPNNSYATYMLALILAESKDGADLERALGYAQRNAALYTNNTTANITLAWVLYQMGRKTEGNQILGRPIQNPSADTRYLIAKIMVDQKQPEQAAALLDQVLKQPGPGIFLYRKEAEALLKQLLDLGISVPQTGLPGEAGGTDLAPPATGVVPSAP